MKLPSAPRAVVTGAASGLGRALALELAARRARLVLADIDPSGSAETLRQVVAAGGGGEVLEADVTRPADLECAAVLAERRWGGIDLLVNNAGVAAVGPVGEVPIQDWEWVLGVNLWGVIHGCHVFVPRFKAQRAGFVLNVASSAGFAAWPEMAPYNASKAAVIALSETLHAELAAHGVGVSVLCPTFFPSRLLESLRTPSERQRAAAARRFQRSRSSARDVARAGLRGLERGHPLIVPQLDGALLHWLKRWFPRAYAAALRVQHGSGG